MFDEHKIHKLQAEIHETHVEGVKLKGIIEDEIRRERALEAANRKRRHEFLSLLKPELITMYDSVDVGTVPNDARAVAGYVGGSWPDYLALVKRFPRAFHVSIAVTASEDADCLDVENGDASPWQAPDWVKRQHHRGIKRPKIYANLSTMPAVIVALRAAGIQRSEVLLWVAWYMFKAIIPKGYDACQYDDKALGKNLDASVCTPDFLE